MKNEKKTFNNKETALSVTSTLGILTTNKRRARNHSQRHFYLIKTYIFKCKNSTLSSLEVKHSLVTAYIS